MQVDLYVNKKFDILKVINLVLKRKDWGKSYTLYKTPTHEVIAQMSSYNFNDRYATFDIKVNEINGNNYYSSYINIYTDDGRRKTTEEVYKEFLSIVFKNEEEICNV